jgi:hypothetical protein
MFLLLVLSCKPDIVEESNKQSLREPAAQQYEIVNGVVHFSDHDSFINTINNLTKLSLSEKVKFGENKGFKSFLDYHKQAIEQYEAMDSVSQKNAQHSTNNKYLIFKNGSPSLNFVNSMIAAVTDHNGLVFVGKSVIRFIGDKEIIVKNGDVSQAMDSFVSADSNVVIFDTDISSIMNSKQKSSVNKNARAGSACPRVYGQTGSFSVYGDGSRVETTTRRVSVPLDVADQYKVYFFVKTQGNFVNSGWFDGNSGNNRLQDVYTCDAYDFDNNLVATRSSEHYSTSTGHSISHEDTAIDAGQCYSFQVPYYYVSLRTGTINPLPQYPCTISNCQYTFPIYTNDKHTISGSCQS